MLKRIALWLRSLALRRRLEREMQEEFAEHLDRATARLMARGLSEEEARREARREFGNVAYLQEAGRYARGGTWLEALAADARFALRQFGRRPGTTVTILALLALGIGINTVLFSFAYSYAEQPPQGVLRSDDLVRIRGSQTLWDDGSIIRSFSREELEAYQGLDGQFREVAGWTNATVTLDAGEEETLRGLEARGVFVTESYFSVLGVRLVEGTGLPSAGPAAGSSGLMTVIGHSTWDQLFGRDPNVIGRTIAVNGVTFTVVGVAPPRFKGINGDIADRLILWLPLATWSQLIRDASAEAEVFGAVGRLRAGVTQQAAIAAVQVVAARNAAPDGNIITIGGSTPTNPSFQRNPSTDVVRLVATSGDPSFEQDVRLMYTAFAVLGLLAVLVTSTNVAALLTGIALTRRREIAVRLSLGAARTRIIRQLLTESLMLAGVGAALAFGIVWVVLRVALVYVPQLPFEIVLSAQTAAITAGAALTVGILFGLSPSLHATRLAIGDALKDSAASVPAARARSQRGMVVAQVAFTQPLIVGLAAVTLIGIGEYQRQRPPEDGDRIINVQLVRRTQSPMIRWTPGPGEVSESMQRWREQMLRLADRLEAIPGVESAVQTTNFSATLNAYAVHPEDRVAGGNEERLRMSGPIVDQGYFAVRGIPVVRGREFEPTDPAYNQPGSAEAPIILGDDLTRILWPGVDPIGRRLRRSDDSSTGAPTLVVVGVVDQPDSDRGSPRDGYRVYLPPSPTLLGVSQSMLVRTASTAEPVIPAIRLAVGEEMPGMGIANLRTLADITAEERRYFRIAFAALGGGAFLALFLSAIGLYAVASFAVRQRTGEIAVRMAIGARAWQIAGRFLADGFRLSVIGVLLGLPISLVGLRYLMGLEPTLSVGLPAVGAIAVIGVLAVAGAASWIPARRAAGIEPSSALRVE